MRVDRLVAVATVSTSTAVLVVSMWWLLGWQPTPTPGLTSGLDPVVVTLSVVRGAALALGGYLLAVTALAVVARLLRLPGAVVGLVEGLAPSALRHLLRSVAGVTMTTMATASPALATTATPAPSSVVLVRGAEPPADLPSGDEPVVMHRLPDVDHLPPPAAPADALPESGGTGTKVVEPGDHFWSIAEQHLAAMRGRPVTDAEIDPFWRTLVEVNRHLTPDPDLLVPGQVVQLPSTS